MIAIWCEWDIGNEYLLFKTEQAAKIWATQALKDSGIEETFEECFDDGLIGFHTKVLHD